MPINAQHLIINESIAQLARHVHDVAEHYYCHSCRMQRLSYDTARQKSAGIALESPSKPLINLQAVQGLSLAQHRPFGEVILKWELRRVEQTFRAQHPHKTQDNNTSSLLHECEVLQQLAGRGCSVALLQTIEEEVTVLGANWQLTIAVLPYYPLGSLKNYLKDKEFDKSQKMAVLVAAAQALFALHQADWTHGDIKPSNFLVRANFLVVANSLVVANPLIIADQPEFQLVLNDFALARPIQTLPPVPSANHSDLALTLPKGTPAYLAPECWQGQGSSVQSDIYAFGIMVFEVLTGHRPYQIERENSDSQDKVLHQWAVAHCQYPIPRLPVEWQEYQSILDKMLAKRKAQRLSEIVEFIRLIE